MRTRINVIGISFLLDDETNSRFLFRSTDRSGPRPGKKTKERSIRSLGSFLFVVDDILLCSANFVFPLPPTLPLYPQSCTSRHGT